MDSEPKKQQFDEEEKSSIRELAEKLLSYKNYESRIREMLDFVKKCFEKEKKKVVKSEEDLEEAEKCSELILAKSIVEHDIKFTNIIFQLLIDIELNRKKAHSSVFHKIKEESDDMDIDEDEDEDEEE
jgi:uncharacterized glyoxalase superfamily protein PhnB